MTYTKVKHVLTHYQLQTVYRLDRRVHRLDRRVHRLDRCVHRLDRRVHRLDRRVYSPVECAMYS